MTKEELIELFWVLFDTLPLPVQQIARKYWATGDPFFFVGRKQIIEYHELFQRRFLVIWAAVDGSSFLFDLEQIQKDKMKLCQIIYHEIAHVYLFATNQFDELQYRHVESVQKKCEVATTALEKVWTDSLTLDVAQCPRLRANSLIQKHTKAFDLTPL